MRVTFLRDFDWQPPERKGRVTIAYKAGMCLLVRKICAADAIAAGAAVAAAKAVEQSSNGEMRHG